jgi:hypothetical protein
MIAADLQGKRSEVLTRSQKNVYSAGNGQAGVAAFVKSQVWACEVSEGRVWQVVG